MYIYLAEEGNYLTRVAIYSGDTPVHVQFYKFDIDMIEDALQALGVDYKKGILVKGDSEYVICFELTQPEINIETVFEYIEIQVHVFLTEYFMHTYARDLSYYEDKLTALIALKLIPLLEDFDREDFDNFTAHIMEYEKNNPIDSDERTHYRRYRQACIIKLLDEQQDTVSGLGCER